MKSEQWIVLKTLKTVWELSTVLIMKIEGGKDAVSECIKKVPGVSDINDITFEEPGIYTYKIEIEKDEVRKNIMTALIKKDFVIDEVKSRKTGS